MADTAEEADISAQLLQLYDEFTVFNDDCAFLCDAFASMATTNETFDVSTVRGLASHANWLKQRSGKLKSNLKQIWDNG